MKTPVKENGTERPKMFNEITERMIEKRHQSVDGEKEEQIKTKII